MHRDLTEGNTKLVLILARPWPFRPLGRVFTNSFSILLPRSICSRCSHHMFYMNAYELPINAHKISNADKILQSQGNYRPSINTTIYIQLRLSALMLPVRLVSLTGQTGPILILATLLVRPVPPTGQTGPNRAIS